MTKDEISRREFLTVAGAAGCEEVVFFESTPLQWNETWDATHSIIQKYSA
jgi:hypothetical protein